MTAINLLMMPDAVHIFTDAGHYHEDRTLVKLESKVYPLHHWNAVLLFNGPSIGGPLIQHQLSQCRPADDWKSNLVGATRAIESQIGTRPFSSILVGYKRGPFGMAIEEGNRYHPLSIASVIRSLKTDIQFDPNDIVESGLSMMRDQRINHSVVAGWCDYTRIDSSGINTTVLGRFNG